MDNFIRNVYLPLLKNDIISSLQQNNIPVDVEKCFDKYENVFGSFLSENKRFKALTSRLPENQYIDATLDRHFPYDQSMI